MSQVLDFLGNELKVGDEIVRAGAYKSFHKGIVLGFEERKRYGIPQIMVKIKSRNWKGNFNSKPGYTYSYRLIKQK